MCLLEQMVARVVMRHLKRLEEVKELEALEQLVWWQMPSLSSRLNLNLMVGQSSGVSCAALIEYSPNR